MKFKTLLIIAVLFTAFLSSCVDEDIDLLGNWVTKAYYGSYARGDGSSFAIDGYGYWGMGYDGDEYFTDFWKYDPVKNTWSQVADFLGTPRAYNVSVSSGSKGYVGLGYDGDDDLADMWEYDAESNSWDSIVSFLGGARRFATAFAINDILYVGTGSEENGKKYLNDFYKYDGSSWELIPSLTGQKRIKANTVVLDGKAHIISGKSISSILTDHWVFDPETEIWTELDDLSDDDTGDNRIARQNASAFVSNGKIYLVGGNSGSSSLNTVFEWNPNRAENGMWIEKTSIEEGISREGAGCFVLNDFGYIVGGRSGGTSYLDDCYMFQPYAEADSDDN